jgi:hypothetical protein
MVEWEECGYRTNMGRELLLRLLKAYRAPREEDGSIRRHGFFNYVLMHTMKMAAAAEGDDLEDFVARMTFRQFLSCLLYIGKGHRQRPFHHFEEVDKVKMSDEERVSRAFHTRRGEFTLMGHD